MAFQQWRQALVQKELFAVEDIRFRPGDFAVDAQSETLFGHGIQCVGAAGDVGDPGVRIGGGPRRVEFDGMHPPTGSGALDFGGRGVISEIEGHQGLEPAVRRGRGEDAVTIGAGLLGGDHRRNEIGHDNGAPETLGAPGHHVLEHRPIPQMQVPVVRAGQGERVHGGQCTSRSASAPARLDSAGQRDDHARLTPIAGKPTRECIS